MDPHRAKAAWLNQTCTSVVTDLERLHQYLDQELAGAVTLGAEHAHLFSPLPVFVCAADLDTMRAVAAAITRVASLPGYQSAVLPGPALSGRQTIVTGGLLQGFDFHLTPAGPRLIEVNTNAGGVLLNTALLRAAVTTDAFTLATPATADPAATEERIAHMFFDEWSRQRPEVPLRRIAIVDDDPQAQFLAAEFHLFKKLLARHGVRTVIADPATLALVNDELFCADEPVDLVYNRLTDFALDAPEHRVLRSAAACGVPVTPNPEAHAIFANKHNLVLLRDAPRLREWGADDATIDLLADAIPPAESVRAVESAALWARRRSLFFKPARGFGSRGAYRGDKLTKNTFAAISAGDYIAQTLVPPAERAINTTTATDGPTLLKYDIRLYAHDGTPLLFAARLYQGQTTNFRTPKGGFAPVYVPADEPSGTI